MRNIGKSNNIKLRDAQMDALVEVFNKAKSKEDVKAIVNSLLSPSEKSAIAQRLAIILRVFKGDTYADIEMEYGSSPSTITKATDYYLKYSNHNAVFNKLIKNINSPSINTPKKTPNTKFTKANYPGAIKI